MPQEDQVGIMIMKKLINWPHGHREGWELEIPGAPGRPGKYKNDNGEINQFTVGRGIGALSLRENQATQVSEAEMNQYTAEVWGRDGGFEPKGVPGNIGIPGRPGIPRPDRYDDNEAICCRSGEG